MLIERNSLEFGQIVQEVNCCSAVFYVIVQVLILEVIIVKVWIPYLISPSRGLVTLIDRWHHNCFQTCGYRVNPVINVLAFPNQRKVIHLIFKIRENDVPEQLSKFIRIALCIGLPGLVCFIAHAVKLLTRQPSAFTGKRLHFFSKSHTCKDIIWWSPADCSGTIAVGKSGCTIIYQLHIALAITLNGGIDSLVQRRSIVNQCNLWTANGIILIQFQERCYNCILIVIVLHVFRDKCIKLNLCRTRRYAGNGHLARGCCTPVMIGIKCNAKDLFDVLLNIVITIALVNVTQIVFCTSCKQQCRNCQIKKFSFHTFMN